MGNCICKKNACCCLPQRTQSEQLWLCCAEFAGKLNEKNISQIAFFDEDTRESFLETSSEGDDPRSSSQSTDILQLGLPPDRHKIDQPILEADILGLESIAKSLDFPLHGCQKQVVVHQAKECIHVIRKVHGRGELFGAERIKVSISRVHLRVYTLTWNMNGKKAALLDLLKLGRSVDREQYDLFVVGLQEAPCSDVESVLITAFGEAYSVVAAAVMVSLQLFVICKKTLEEHFEDVRVDKVSGGGFGGVIRRQKGAVAVSFIFKDVSFLFISSHLTPHEGNVEERNLQFQRISQTLFCSRASNPRLSSCLNGSSPEDSTPPGYNSSSGGESLNTTIVEDSDLVVWLGDLNYRIQYHRSLVDALISQNLYKSLWHKDQLCREIQKGHVFKGFREGPLSFRPTYKYDVGTDNYDTSPKERVPSWTDRILYKVKDTKKGVKVDVCDYDAVNSVKSSDHRPVKAVFTLSHC